MGWKIDFRCHPRIHAEDAKAAIHAWLDRRQKSRERISEQVIVEDLFLASLANRHKWEPAEIDQIAKSSVDKSFRERFARAIEQGKSPTFDKIDILILENWRKLRLKPAFEAKHRKLPGLQDWSPKAIAGLFSHAGILNPDYEGDFEDWFKKRRQRLGLRGKNRYLIENFIAIDNTTRIIWQGGTRKSFSCPGK